MGFIQSLIFYIFYHIFYDIIIKNRTGAEKMKIYSYETLESFSFAFSPFNSIVTVLKSYFPIKAVQNL